MTEIKKTICPYDCPMSCGILAETDGKRILRVKGDPEHPASKGLICNKMQHYEESIHSPERILTPLKRMGKKGKAGLRRLPGMRLWLRSAADGSRFWKLTARMPSCCFTIPA